MKPNELPQDPDLRNALKALERAGIAARKKAFETGTRLVVMHNGQVTYLQGKALQIAEPDTPYRQR